MRVFIGFQISPGVAETLANAQRKLLRTGADIKLVEPHNLHICLRFLGDITENKLQTIKDLLESSLAGHKSIEFSVQGIGVFPNKDYIRVIWAGIEDQGKLAEIAKIINHELHVHGFANNNKSFKAHLTLGRVRSARNREKLAEIIENLNLEAGSMQVTKISLYSSELTPQGPVYKEEFSVRLA